MRASATRPALTMSFERSRSSAPQSEALGARGTGRGATDLTLAAGRLGRGLLPLLEEELGGDHTIRVIDEEPQARIVHPGDGKEMLALKIQPGP